MNRKKDRLLICRICKLNKMFVSSTIFKGRYCFECLAVKEASHKEKRRISKKKNRDKNKQKLMLVARAWKKKNRKHCNKYNSAHKNVKNAKVREARGVSNPLNDRVCIACSVFKNGTEFAKRNSLKCRACHIEIKAAVIFRRKELRKYHSDNKTALHLAHSLRRSIRTAILRVGHVKKNRSLTILGCDVIAAEAHLIATALENYGMYIDGLIDFEIDHRVPVSWVSTYDDAINLCHISNLQYLTPYDNRRKSNRIGVEPTPLLEQIIKKKSIR